MNKNRYFSQIITSEIIELPKHMPDIEQTVSAIVDPEIISLKAVNTMKGKSIEGQCLSGKKMAIELCIKQKILYAANVKEQSLHILQSEFFKSVYVVIPPTFEGSKVEDLLKNKFIKVEIKVEEVILKLINERTIEKSLILFVEVCFVPTYEICCSIHNNCTKSNLHIVFDDGCNMKQKTFSDKCKNIKCIWSPLGKEIAFISNCECGDMLYVLDITCGTIRRITKPSDFECIISFCWAKHGNSIIFSGVIKNAVELFCINLCTLEYKQLTYGDRCIKSYKPKCSNDGKKIAFLKCVSEVTNLWLMDINSLDSKKLTSEGCVKGFDWCLESNFIAYISDNGTKGNKVSIVNVNNSEIKDLHICKSIYYMKNLLYSPSGEYIGFIGDNLDTEDIYIYSLNEGKLSNITNNINDIKVNNFVWKVDSSEIYYSSNDLGYYNIYYTVIRDLSKHQITNLSATNIELDYRPRIV